MKSAFFTCVLLSLIPPGLYADHLPNYRVVVTFYRWEDARVEYNLTEATVVKQYGRRLVLSLSEQVNETTIDEKTFKLGQEIGLTLIESIELDSFVSVVSDPDMYALMDENTSFSMNDAGLYIESQSLFQWNLADSEPFSIHAESIWKTTHGTPDVVVAVIDSGLAMASVVEFLHWSPGYDFVSDPDISMDGDGRDYDSSDYGDVGPGCTGWSEPSWHGTKVANILAANHETMAIRGVAQNVTVMPVRVLGLCGSGYANDVADAIVWSAGGQINGISYNPTPSQIISLSIAGHGKCPGYLQSAVNQAIGLGSVIIAAAGNDGAASINNTFPANCVGVISVGASDRQGGLASYSNAGASLIAPGGDSTDGVYAITVDKGTWKLKPVLVSGTSVSVPHIAGLAALYWTNISASVNVSATDVLIRFLVGDSLSNNTTGLELPLTNGSEMVWGALDGYSIPPTCDYFLGIGCGCNYNCAGGICTATTNSLGGHSPSGAINGVVGASAPNMWHTGGASGTQWLRVEFPTSIKVVGGVARVVHAPGRGALFKISVGNNPTFDNADNTLCYTSISTYVQYERFQCGATGKYLFYWRYNGNDYFGLDELTVYKSSYGINCTCLNGTYINGLDCSTCPVSSYCNNQMMYPCPSGLSSPVSSYDVSQCITTCSPSVYQTLSAIIPSITVTPERALINWARACGVNQNTACTATAYSTWSNDFLPSKALDGITGYTSATTTVDNCYHSLGTGTTQYLRIDFGVVRNIEKGSMWNRISFCDSGNTGVCLRGAGYEFYVGNDGSSALANTLCYTDSGTNITNRLYGFCQNFTCVASGRYVFVRTPRNDNMHVGEVEFFGRPCYCPYEDMTVMNGMCTCTTTECAQKLARCTAGTYNTGADSSNISAFNISNCQACSSGTYSSVIGSNSSETCIQCAMGSYSMGSGSSACIKCQAGTYSTTDFANSSGYCQDCPSGTYSVVTGSNSPLACISCVLGSYSLGSASTTCVLCQKGTYSTESYANASSTCQACPDGTYSILLGLNSSSSCISCPAGSYTLNSGSTVCLYCQAGTFSNTTNATAASTCQACQSGFHSTAVGASSTSACTACATGGYGLGVTLSSCVSCVAGTYSTSLYAELVTNCKQCQIGTYSAVVGAMTQMTCMSCANGAYSSGLALSACTSCPTGTYSLTTKASLASSCISCVAGTYSATVGASSSGVCLNCTTGSYNLGAGLSTCVQCVTGTYSTSVASAALANCLACVAGTYSATVGASSSGVCLNCATGSYNLGAGLSTCVQCVAGTYSITIASSALANCLACAGGFYSAALGASSNATCLSCAVGSYTLGTASTLCTLCIAGTYSTTVNAVTSSNCVFCSSGTYSAVIGSNSPTTCTNCSVGSFSAIPVVSVCTSCTYGYYGTEAAATACKACQARDPWSACAFSDCVSPYVLVSATSNMIAYSPPTAQYSSSSYMSNQLYYACYSIDVIATTGGTSCAGWAIDTSLVGTAYATLDLLTLTPVQNIVILGRADLITQWVQYVTSVKISISNDNVNYIVIASSMQASKDVTTPVYLPLRFVARYIRIYPLTYAVHPVMRFGIVKDNSTCAICNTGLMSSNGACGCPPGTYKMETNRSTLYLSDCQGCSSGTYSTMVGSNSSSMCLSCQPGTYGNGTGTTVCITCNWGYYSSDNASTTCTQCQSGLVTTSTGSTSCTLCPGGTILGNYFKSVISPPTGASNNPVPGVADTYYMLFPYTTDNSGGTGQTTYSLTIPNSGLDYTADILLVAGGGGGGDSMGGGGGGGGVLYKQGAILKAGETYSIKVGNGGINGVAAQGGASDGKNTVAFGGTVYGGGGGGHQYSNLDPGNNGGCGGGGTTNEGGTSSGGSVVTGIPGTSVLIGATVYGNVGGTGYYGNGCGGGGGGGGAGTPGIGSICAKAGKGGDGIQIAITGKTLYWAGGGGGGSWGADAGNGGLGGGGGGVLGNKGGGLIGTSGGSGLNPAGTPIDSKAGNGGASTGSGGGGTRYSGAPGTLGGFGGSGVVIVQHSAGFVSMCTPCPIGKFSSVNATACTSCQAGTYSNVTSASTCLSCPPGTYSNITGSTGSGQCIKCDWGYYSTNNASTTCTQCQSGLVTTSTGSTSCTLCPGGTILGNYFRSVISPPSGASNNPVPGVADTYYLLFPYTTDNSGGTGQTTYSLTIPNSGLNYTADILMVAGGGGGGDSMGGGGGGGGVLYKQGATLIAGETYSIKVGNGGINGVAAQGGASDGKNTVAFGGTVFGGGGGGHQYSTVEPGNNGGSGGGGCGSGGNTGGAGGTVISGIPGVSVLSGATVYGQIGGVGLFTSAGSGGGGGGGGAGTVGKGCISGRAGDGGNGIPIDITGQLLYWAGGGGGGGWYADSGNGGLGGGGGSTAGFGLSAIGGGSALNPGVTPATSNSNAGAGGASTGGGGGGARYASPTFTLGGYGGSGVVIVRYSAIFMMCTPCPIGKFSSVNATACTSCQTGTYSNVTSASTCLSCPPGTYGNVNGSTACITCFYGFYSDTYASSACTACQAGTYSNVTSASTCSSCPPGTYGNGTGSTACISCDYESYSDAYASSACTLCESGKFTYEKGSNSSGLCVSCGPGAMLMIGSSVSAVGGTLSTSQAPYYLYTFKTVGSSSTITFSKDTTVDVLVVGGGGSGCCGGGGGGQVVAMSNVLFSSGVYTVTVGVGGTSCGTSSMGVNGGTSSIVKSTFTIQALGGGGGARSSGGTYSVSVANGGGAGFDANVYPTAMSSKVTGFVGGFGDRGAYGSSGGGGGAGAVGGKPYLDPANRDAGGATLQCAGFGGVGVASSLENGNTQYYGGGGGGGTNTNSGTCSITPQGGNGGGGAGSVASSGVNSIGSSGIANTGGGGGGADPEASNTMTGGSGIVVIRYFSRVYCAMCDIGKFKGVDGTTCNPCGAGSYSNVTGSSSCLNCQAGTYSNITGSTMCKACPIGQFSSVDATTCTSCQTPGTYIINSTVCAPCPAGQYSNTSGTTACLTCPNGYGSTANSTNCTKNIVTASTVCDLGSYILDTICVPCSAGSYSANLSVTVCTSCPPGQYNNASGQTRCTGCSPGYGSLASSTTCTACDAGYYSPGNSSCVSCPSGSYGTTTGASTCSSCPSCEESLYRVNCAGASAGVCVACSLVY